MNWRTWRWRWRLRGGERTTRDAALGQAIVAILDGEWEAAERLLGELARADAEFAATRLALARLYRRRGEIGRALHLHQDLLLREDLDRLERRRALRGLAEDFHAGGFWQRAKAAYEQLLQNDTVGDSASLRALVSILEECGEPEQALPLAVRLARLEGRVGGAEVAERWVAVAQLRAERGEVDSARKALRRALRAQRDYPPARFLLGELELQRGDLAKAVAAWRAAVRGDRQFAARMYPKLAEAYTTLGLPREYERFLGRVLRERKGDIAAGIALAHALAARGAIAEALDALQPFLESHPGHLGVHAARGRLLLRAGDSEKCSEAYSALLDLVERRAAAEAESAGEGS